MSFDPTTKTPRCDMEKGCPEPVTHLDQKGYVYCTEHGLDRRRSQPCRKLRTFELNRLARGEQVNRY